MEQDSAIECSCQYVTVWREKNKKNTGLLFYLFIFLPLGLATMLIKMEEGCSKKQMYFIIKVNFQLVWV